MLFSFRVIASPLAMQMDLPDVLLLGHYRYADGSLRLLWFFFFKMFLLIGTMLSFCSIFVHAYSPPPKLI